MQSLFTFASFLILCDLFMVLLMILAVGSGADVQHIPFWDSQMRVIVSLFG